MDTFNKKVENLYKNIKYVFKEPTLLGKIVKRLENISGYDHNDENIFQRLEFLGDSVLNLVVSDFLYKFLSNEPVGVLSIRRALLVKSKYLENVSESIGLPSFLTVDRSKVSTKVILGDAVEALIGAMYIDGGFENTKSFIIREWRAEMVNNPKNDDYKSILQNWAVKNRKPLPKYYLIETRGHQHNLRFKTSACVSGVGKGHGDGSTRKEAEANAAYNLFNKIKKVVV